MDNEKSKMREILEEMDKSGVSLQEFFEQVEKESGSHCKFSKFKSLLEDFYPQQQKGKKL